MDQALLRGLSPVLRLPPERRYLVLPTRDRRAVVTGLTLLSSCGRRALLLQSAARLAVRVAGSRVLPGPRESWTPPLDESSWAGLLSDWERELGPYDNLAVYQRPQASRAGLAVVPMRRGHPLAVIKVRPDDDGLLGREIAVLRALGGTVAGLRVPRVRQVGEDRSGWRWLAMDVITTGVHRPVRLRRPQALDEQLTTRLSCVLPRPDRVPEHWRPMHGDLSPWNLRQDRRGSVLIDWEDATWGPPHADRVYFALSWHTALGGPAPIWAPADDEARDHWRTVLRARPAGDEDSATSTRMLSILG